MKITDEKNKLKSTNIAMLFTHGINNIVSLFVSTFLISYIYSISNNYIKDIGIFYVCLYLSMMIFYTIISHFIDRTNRVWFYRAGVVVKSLFIVCVIFLGRDLARFVSLAGALYGFAESCYWSSYNLMKNELVSKHAVEKYSLFQFIDEKTITIVVPLILGKIIDGESFKICAIIVLCAVALQLIMTIFIKSKRPENSSFSLKGMIDGCKKLEKDQQNTVKFSLIVGVFYGIAKVGAPINTILIMIFFGSNFSLGVFTSIFAAVSMILLLFYKKWTTLGKRNIIYMFSVILPVIAAAVMVLNLNKVTLIIYTLVYTLAVVLYEFSYDVMRNTLMKKVHLYDSIAEYQCAVEGVFQIGRILGFAAMALIGVLTAGMSAENLQLTLKIMSFVSICLVSTAIALVGVYENKFKKTIITID